MDEEPAATRTHPVIIQGGMGIGVSDWRLARAVSRHGHLGVVSGTALGTVLVRRLQSGDPDGDMRRALAHCPLVEACTRIIERHWVDGGIPPDRPFRLAPLHSLDSPRDLLELTIVANYAEVYLAKEGHDGPVGLNLLEKLQLPTLASLFGALLAGVDYVLMGAGIPRAIPGVLDDLAAGRNTVLRVAVEGADPSREHLVGLDPSDYFPHGKPPVRKRPHFLAIVSSSTLATTLARKATGRVDGFVVEGFEAGGHNAPPRGPLRLDPRGEPVYGPRDVPDLTAIRALGLPFWLAGGEAHPERLRAAIRAGAAGVQVGTAFAFCQESGLAPHVKQSVLSRSTGGNIVLRTDPRASPTGMPFKVVDLEGTVSVPAVYHGRSRSCDLGYLRQPYTKEDGSAGYRCPAEPEADHVRKGGAEADTAGRLCLCNGLLAAIGLGQRLPGGGVEPAVVTAGEDVASLHRFLHPGKTSYTAADVLAFMEPERAHRSSSGIDGSETD